MLLILLDSNRSGIKPGALHVLRYDGWSALLFEASDPIGRNAWEVPPPTFCTLRRMRDGQEVWFQNVDASVGDLIAFYRAVDV